MKEMTTSEVSRNLSAVLDEAERGGTIAVTRNGDRVALIVPAPRANGAALDEVFRRWGGVDLFDAEFVAAVESLREVVDPALDRDPWTE